MKLPSLPKFVFAVFLCLTLSNPCYSADSKNADPKKDSRNYPLVLGFSKGRVNGVATFELGVGVGVGLFSSSIANVTSFTPESGGQNGLSSVAGTDNATRALFQFNVGLGYDLIVNTGKTANFYTSIGFYYNLMTSFGTKINFAESSVAGFDNATYGPSTGDTISYDLNSSSTASMSDLFHILGAKFKFGASLLEDRLKVYSIIGLGALLPVSVNASTSTVASQLTMQNTNVPDFTNTFNADSSASAVSSSVFLPAFGVGTSYDIIPRRVSVFFEFEGMPFFNNFNLVDVVQPVSGTFRPGTAGTGVEIDHNVATSIVIDALLTFKTGVKIGF